MVFQFKIPRLFAKIRIKYFKGFNFFFPLKIMNDSPFIGGNILAIVDFCEIALRVLTDIEQNILIHKTTIVGKKD